MDEVKFLSYFLFKKRINSEFPCLSSSIIFLKKELKRTQKKRANF